MTQNFGRENIDEFDTFFAICQNFTNQSFLPNTYVAVCMQDIQFSKIFHAPSKFCATR